jgi:hypothetical protein
MKTIADEYMNFKDFENLIFKKMCRTACEIIGQYLELCDKRIMASRDPGKYRCVDSRTTTIKTLMGEVAFSRYYYKRRTGGYVFLLDEVMGLNGSSGLFSENLAEQIVIECSDKPFRKAASSISSLTGQTISAMGAWNIVQQFGETIQTQEAKLKELDENDTTCCLGNVKSPVIFEELDDVWLSVQHENRRKRCAAAGKRKKAGKKPMHIGIAYTGWTCPKDGKYNTENKVAYASFCDVPGFNSRFETILRHCFDIDGVRHRITNGDGEPWIRKAAETNDSILQLDPYHRSQAVIRAVSDKSDRKSLFDAIFEKDVDKVLNIIRALTANAQDEATQKKLGKLYGYFSNNRDIFLTWQERGIKLPAPPAGVSYRNLGIQESSNCSLITQRMKHRRGSWSEKGADNMAKILCFRNTIGLDAILGALPKVQTAAVCAPEPLSAAKAPQYDGKGYGADWLYAEMPFEQTFKTNGREVIKGLLRQRPVSGAAFI